VASASTDDTAQVWDRASDTTLSLAHGGDVYRARFTPDGSHLVTASFDGSVRLFRLGETEPSLTLPVGVGALVWLAVTNTRAVALSTMAGGNMVHLEEWPALLDGFSRATHACLSAQERSALLGESPAEAARLFQECAR
jgi:WD40 repeat protein